MTDTSETAPIENVVCDALGEVLGVTQADLRARPVLATHEWDSVASLEVLSRLESRLAVTLDLRAYHGARTVEDLIELVAAVASSTAAGRR